MHEYRWMDTYIMLWNIFEKHYAQDVKARNEVEKKTHSQKKESEEDFNACI